jgi:cytidylate kinase
LRIAIDGPAGAGKSTVAKKLAERLGLTHVDTGAMYRAVALAAIKAGISCEDEENLARLVQTLQIGFSRSEDGETAVCLGGQEVSREIRTPEVSRCVSLVARVPAVRRFLTEIQRQLAAGSGVVMEGRDIGTVVLPDAEKKFFLTASVEERARRRFLETARDGHQITLADQINEIVRRDTFDTQRKVAPLIPAPDAVVIDTTERSPDEVVALILAQVQGG